MMRVYLIQIIRCVFEVIQHVGGEYRMARSSGDYIHLVCQVWISPWLNFYTETQQGSQARGSELKDPQAHFSPKLVLY